MADTSDTSAAETSKPVPAPAGDTLGARDESLEKQSYGGSEGEPAPVTGESETTARASETAEPAGIASSETMDSTFETSADVPPTSDPVVPEDVPQTSDEEQHSIKQSVSESQLTEAPDTTEQPVPPITDDETKETLTKPSAEVPEALEPTLEPTKELFSERVTEPLTSDLTDLNSMVPDAEKTVSDTEKTVSDKEKTVSDAEKTVSDVEKTVSDTENTVSDTGKTIPDVDNTVPDVENTGPDAGNTEMEVDKAPIQGDFNADEHISDHQVSEKTDEGASGTLQTELPPTEVTISVKSELIDEITEPQDVEMADSAVASEVKTESPDVVTEVETPQDNTGEQDVQMASDGPLEAMTTDEQETNIPVAPATEPPAVAAIEDEQSAVEAEGTAMEADEPAVEEERTVTMLDVLQEQQDLEDDAGAVLGASDDNNCTYAEGYIKRQALYACMTCCGDAKDDPNKRAGVCLACSLACHENHELIELYTKRNFRCDCGNPNFNSNRCTFTKEKNEINVDNKYNQNFSGLYCICHRPYPDPESTVDEEMIQCIVCEDWLHTSHLGTTVPASDQYAEMICKSCMDKNEFLHDYSCYAVSVEDKDVDVLNGNSINELEEESAKVSEEVEKPGCSDIGQAQNQDDSSSSKIALEDKLMNEQKDVVEDATKETNDVGQESLKEKANLELDSAKLRSENLNEEIDQEKTEVPKVVDNATEETKIHEEEKNQDDGILEKESSVEEAAEKEGQTIEKVVNISEILTQKTETSTEMKEDDSNVSTEITNESNEIKEKPEAPVNELSENKLKSPERTPLIEDNGRDETASKKEALQERNQLFSETSLEDKLIDSTENKKVIDETVGENCDLIENISNPIEKPVLNEEDKVQNTYGTDTDGDDPEIKTDENRAEEPMTNKLKSDDNCDNTLNGTSTQDVSKAEDNSEASDTATTQLTPDVEMHSEETNINKLPIEVESKVGSDSISDSIKEQKRDTCELKTDEIIDRNIKGTLLLEDGQVEGESKDGPSNVPSVDINPDIETHSNETSISNLPTAEESKTDLDMDSSSSKDKNAETSLTEEAGSVAADVEMKDDSVQNNLSEAHLEGAKIAGTDIQTPSNVEIETIEKDGGETKMNGDVHQDKDVEIETTNKRKLSTEISDDVEQLSVKKVKLDKDISNGDLCRRAKSTTKKAYKGATFWPCSWRQKLCSCHNCVSMYRDLSVLFLLDNEDTVSAYEELGKSKNGGKVSQYEKGLAALSSLDRIQQINALTEYNKMKDELLDFLISFRNRQEVVKVEDIEKFFADIKPKRKSDGVYFCR